MADSTNTPEGFSLKRWSRRKLDAAKASSPPVAPAAIAPHPAEEVAATPAVRAPEAPVTAAAPPLPPVESLTHDSDFSAFMQPKVDELVKRAALKKLFTDPRFNVMDGLDIYVGDYTQADPMPEGMLEKLGKVYAAVTHDEDAATGPAAAAPKPAQAAPDVVAAPDAVTAKASTIEAEPSAPATIAAVSPPLQDSSVAIPPPAPPSGKPP